MKRTKGLDYFVRKFENLRRDRKFGGGPHKPILLLSLIDLIEGGKITSPVIYISPEIVSRFRDFWKALVTTPHNCSFGLPYFHLRSEGYWTIVPKPGKEIAITKSRSIRSFSNLRDNVAYAKIDLTLFLLLSTPEPREILRTTLLTSYFPDSMMNDVPSQSYLDAVGSEILHESSIEYKRRVDFILNHQTKEEQEEEKFIRGAAFKREIPRIYNNTCSISGMKIETSRNISIIDACHIVPFSSSHDDTISNGIALCPNIHRAFDRGLIAISDDYRVLVANDFKEPEGCIYSIRQFEGREIILPKSAHYYPDVRNLRMHREGNRL